MLVDLNVRRLAKKKEREIHHSFFTNNTSSTLRMKISQKYEIFAKGDKSLLTKQKNLRISRYFIFTNKHLLYPTFYYYYC